MIVRELVTKLGFKVEDAPMKRVDKGLASLKKTALLASAAIAGVGTALIAITKNVANIGDDLAKTSARVGISVENLQKFDFAAKLAGSSLETFRKGVVRLSKNMVDAQDGLATAKEAFEKLGLDPHQFKDTEEAIFTIADKFKDMEDGYLKTAIAQDLFGRAGAQLINMLNGGSEAIKAQGEELESLRELFDDASAKEAEEFNDTLLRMNEWFNGLKIVIGKELIPVVTDVMKQFVEWAKLNKDLIKTKLVEYTQVLIKFFKAFFKILRAGMRRVRDFVNASGGMENALETLVKLFKILIGLKIAFALGNIAMGFVQMAAAMRLAGLTTGSAGAAGFVLFAAKLAAIAGAALLVVGVFEDVQVALKGGNSLLEKFVGKFIEWKTEGKRSAEEVQKTFRERMSLLGNIFELAGMNSFEKFFAIWKEGIKGFFKYLQTKSKEGYEAVTASFVADIDKMFKKAEALIKPFWDKYYNLGYNAVTSILNKFRELKQELFNFLLKFGLDKVFNIKLSGGSKGGGDRAKGTAKTTSAGLAGFAAANSAGGGAAVGLGTTNNIQQRVNLKNNITVNVETDADAQEIADKVQKEVENGFNRQLRGTMRTLNAT